MYKIQNITRRPIKFQGVEITPYGTAFYAQITDYITLSRLTNSGKIFCVNVPTLNKEVVKEEVKQNKEFLSVEENVKEEKEVIKKVETEEKTTTQEKDKTSTQINTKRNSKKRKNVDVEDN